VTSHLLAQPRAPLPPRRRIAAALAALALILSAPAGVLEGRPEHPPKAFQAYGSGKVLKPEFNDLVRHADLIVVAKVVQIGGIAHPGPSRKRPSTRKYTYWERSYAMLRVEQVVKGKTSRSTLKVAFGSDLEGDKTSYQAGKRYIVFLTRPSKYPDAFTTTHFHYGEYRINDQGNAERVGDSSEISKPPDVVLENIRKAMGPPGKSR
jgi:hypothetical protein